MAKFEVEITQRVVRTAVVDVEAETEDEASEIVWEKRISWNNKVHDSDLTVVKRGD